MPKIYCRRKEREIKSRHFMPIWIFQCRISLLTHALDTFFVTVQYVGYRSYRHLIASQFILYENKGLVRVWLGFLFLHFLLRVSIHYNKKKPVDSCFNLLFPSRMNIGA